MRFKKWLAIGLAAVFSATTLAGCGFNSSGGSEKSAKSDSGSDDDLNIMVWDGTWSEEMFKDFTKKTGIKVNISYISNTDEIMTKLINGSADYDLVDLEAAYVQPFIENDLLQKIDHSKVPNEKYLDPDENVAPPGDKKMEYTITDMGPNYTTIVYNKETCPIEIKSLKDLTNPKLKGQVAMVDSTISLYGAALQALGYKASSTDEKEMKEAHDLLLKIKPNVKAFVGESAVPQLENGEVSAALCWDYPLLCNDSKDNWDKFGFVNLEGGCEEFTQYWTIPKSSKHAEEAEELVNFIYNPEELAKSYKEYGGIPVEKKDVIGKYLPEDYYESPYIEGLKALKPDAWMVPVSSEQIDLMDDYYSELKGSK